MGSMGRASPKFGFARLARVVRLSLVVLTLFIGGCDVPSDPAAAAPYDVLILDGTIYDGRGGSPYAADVAIRGTRIVALGDFAGASATTVIDAAGLAVAPAFANFRMRSRNGICRKTSLRRSQGFDPFALVISRPKMRRLQIASPKIQ